MRREDEFEFVAKVQHRGDLEVKLAMVIWTDRNDVLRPRHINAECRYLHHVVSFDIRHTIRFEERGPSLTQDVAALTPVVVR